jgi:hypothetical protein
MEYMQTIARNSESQPVSLHLRDIGNDYTERSRGKNHLRIALGPYILRGCGPTIELLLTEKKRDGRRYLTFTQGFHMTAGDFMHIVRPVWLYPTGFLSYRRVLKVIGKVKVLEIVDTNRVEVQLIDGKFFGGTRVEKIDPE